MAEITVGLSPGGGTGNRGVTTHHSSPPFRQPNKPNNKEYQTVVEREGVAGTLATQHS